MGTDSIVPSGSSMVLGSYPGGHPLENGHMEVHGSVLSAHTQGETHWQNDTSLAGRPKDTNPYPGRDPYRGGGASRRLHKGGRPPPFVDSSIWVSPWVRVRVFGTLGQRCVVLPMGFSLGLSTEHSAMCPLSYGCPPGYEPRTIELPLGIISSMLIS